MSTLERISSSSLSSHKSLEQIPRPLLSLELDLIPQNDIDENSDDLRNHSKNEFSQRKTLELLCMKREMVGRILSVQNITFLDSHVTKQVRLLPRRKINRSTSAENEHNMTDDEKEDYDKFVFECPYSKAVKKYSLHIKHYVPFPDASNRTYHNDGGNSHGLFIILPKTNITIASPSTNIMKESQNSKEENLTQSLSVETTNPAVRTLIQTISILLYSSSDNNIPKTFLFSGPPGVGKTHAVRTAIQHFRHYQKKTIKLISIKGSEILGYGLYESVNHLSKLFQSAFNTKSSRSSSLSIIFLDECDALLNEESPSSFLIASQLSLLLDQIHYNNEYVIVVAATNRVETIPVWLRRPGRFDREINVSPPNTKERLKIITSLLKTYYHDQYANKDVDSDDDSSTSSSSSSYNTYSFRDNSFQRHNTSLPALFDSVGLQDVAERCVGYVAADLAALVRRASIISTTSGSKNTSNISINALKLASQEIGGASALRDATLSAPPKTTWADIAGDLNGAKKKLRQAIEWPILKAREFVHLGLSPPRGILLYGPPGCAKTTLARAAAGSAKVAFFSKSPADIFSSSYVGDAEKVIRKSFELARASAPCILFFDEIDAIIGSDGGGDSHSSGMNRGTAAEARVMSTFLNEMDGISSKSLDGVLVLGATNRPKTLDPALLRPGRFDSVIYVPPPDFLARKSIFEMHISKVNLQVDEEMKEETIDIDHLASEELSGQMTGAEIVGACQEASMMAIREAYDQQTIKTNKDLEKFVRLRNHHLETALRNVKPLLSSSRMLEEYSSFQDE